MLKRLFKEELGQGVVEYGLIIALIVMVVIGAFVAVNGGLNGIFNNTGSNLSSPSFILNG
ncbi:pilus assembly protein Flp/PilA [Hydrogenispora ethanolica]|jgi:pilus assembly protein Flp/PilA|uniref:Pilus assembly protein Flp/PilA n=1 Tax=Hydrogenispora ethanolica TaxID=1082276 RepID=A0A4R1RBE3_HYDET|nr:Flp family type IVb pilin [Hydrogenispora ethanolica]TCL62999.1 pilus assembly protein Flp/PilA [Hydrogenispora ethanolica]